MVIREYRQRDLDDIIRLFYDTVHTVCREDYTDEQLDAWADGQADYDRWHESFTKHLTLVAEENGVIVGFGDMDKTGYLDRLYVHVNWQRRKVATALCDELEKRVDAEKLTAYVSITARPFFENRGYRVIKENAVTRKGVIMKNYFMEK